MGGRLGDRVALGVPIADPLIGMAIALVITH
jgi:hypothetical protein